jgi:predicted nucleic acid-binding Zn ribbon protein
MTESAIQVTRRCRTCRGEGIIEAYHCRLCQQPISGDDAWWSSDDDVLPCGHADEYLVETTPCPACDGAGQVEQWLSPAEARAIRRKKAAAAVFVVAALVTLVLVLTIVVWGSPAEVPVCGYWWYGVPALLISGLRLPGFIAGRRHRND